jgi:hypothetical protein
MPEGCGEGLCEHMLGLQHESPRAGRNPIMTQEQALTYQHGNVNQRDILMKPEAVACVHGTFTATERLSISIPFTRKA